MAQACSSHLISSLFDSLSQTMAPMLGFSALLTVVPFALSEHQCYSSQRLDSIMCQDDEECCGNESAMVPVCVKEPMSCCQHHISATACNSAEGEVCCGSGHGGASYAFCCAGGGVCCNDDENNPFWGGRSCLTACPTANAIPSGGSFMGSALV